MNFAHTIDGKKRVHLKEYDPDERRGLTKEEAQMKTAELSAELNELDDLLFAAGQRSLLIILQGRDTSGKDGAIRHLLNSVNVQSCRVVPFKVPTPIELAHDFLWRIHAETPPRGAMHIFNRSHYEDVLVVRVHNLVPEEVWRRRYDHINAFEQLLVDSGTILLKFYLHISKEEQEKRLLEREMWDRYTEAYEEALTRCSTPEIPWYIVPANNKWFRDLAITERIVEALRPYRKPWMEHLSKIGETARRELMEYRAQRDVP
jgi:polyphosphate kinase 2 (PPK2 family)